MKYRIELDTESGQAEVISTSDPDSVTNKPAGRPTCALIVGHRRSSQGATAPDGTSEWAFNSSLAADVRELVHSADVEVVYRDDSPGGYSALPEKVNRLAPDFAVSMHFNSFDERPGQPEVSGTEVLHYPGSTGGIKLGGYLLEEFLSALGLPDRGLKARGPSGRGGTILAGTRCPTVLAEPMFGDNPHDWSRATERRDELAQGYANAIDRYAQTL